MLNPGTTESRITPRMRLLRLTGCAALAAALAAGCAKPPAATGHGPPSPARPESNAAVHLDLRLEQPPAKLTQGAPAGPAAPEAPGADPAFDSAPDPGFDPAFDLGGLDVLRSLAGGLVSVAEFAHEQEPAGYGAQILPTDTNLNAQHDAELWAPDAKQMYIAAGFWRSPTFGLTKHVFYSTLRDEKYILYYRLFKGIVQRRIRKAGPDYKTAVNIMRAAQDVHSFDLIRAHQRAKVSAYRPTGPITVGVLIDPMLIGPCWVFLDNPEDQRPQIAVRAKDGTIFREGNLAFEAIKILVQKSDD